MNLRFRLDTPINPELDREHQQLGPAAEAASESFIVEVQPTAAVNLDDLLRIGKWSPFDRESRSFADVWLLFHTLHVSPNERETLSSNPTGPASVALEVEFDDSVRATVLDVFPKTEFVNVAHGKIACSIRLSTNGAGIHSGQIDDNKQDPVYETAAKTQADIEACAELRFQILTSKIISVGVHASKSEWYLYEREQPLFGEHTLAHTVWVPPGTQNISYICRVRAAAGGWRKWFSSPRKPAWGRVQCDLATTLEVPVLDYLLARGIIIKAIDRTE
ncbi:hypothetical protein [Chondromyces crocatus]|uniref:Uncharacterized protein n=1 Tax=Chondromyces crocatus TaxID=52 RepID=A0A0K1EBE4_CHOCO|nr:hypothetical protein [Chondromyces crocatus]AKT38180.1 uncharacterized protein CMC5_023230 [Chondromyces crocatus]